MRRYLILAVLACVLLVAVLIKVVRDFGHEKQSTAQAQSPPIEAECYRARDTVILCPVKAVGNLRANERVEVVSEMARRITKVLFKEGSVVKAGDLLFQLDDAEWIADLKKCQAQLELARETEKRNIAVLKSGGISQQVADESVNNRVVLEAVEENLKVQIEKAKIRAPFSGKVGIRNVSLGAYVIPGAVLTIVEDLSCLKLIFTVPENQANAIKKGDHLEFRREGIARNQTAIIEAVDPSVTTNTGDLRVLALVQHPDPGLMAGTAVTVFIETHSAVPGIYIPTQALIPTPAGYKVYVIDQGKARLKPITAGFRSDKMVAVINGIKIGDQIMLTGLMKVRPDANIHISKSW
ncbi:MAG: efflux RND transporter periplasmic adaptor subunit [Bacteroidota bacterium]